MTAAPAMAMTAAPAMTMTAAPFMYGGGVTTGMPMTAGMAPGMGMAGGSLFDMLDRNHDGKITKSEFAGFMR